MSNSIATLDRVVSLSEQGFGDSFETVDGFDSVGAEASATWYEMQKRAIDIVAASIAVVLLSPLFLVVALLIKLTSRGPVLFVQTRVGRGGREFRCFKFRSMVANAEALQRQLAAMNHHADERTFKIRRDPRITRIGEVLRKTSIDEMPQLFNVLRGDMSLVGPRPPLPREVAKYEPYEFRRLAVQPGLTCFWQVSGRGDIPFPRQVEMDISYIEQRSLLLDLKLLLLTIPAVVLGKGAY
ncbi:MAG TPA: sugar transferase [Pirellulales bacterium]|jgi:exopolysaccharide biosynthesis polyprenyl glycosylphosphotransferase|nr:sugar transferase [Pirellulales bacterium]